MLNQRQIDHILDTVQFRVTQAENEVKRLQARVTALEASAPLPPDQKVEITPTPQPKQTCEQYLAESKAAAEAQQPDVLPELDLSKGLTVGSR